MPKLIGYRKFVGKKDGKNYCVASCISELTPTEKDNGYVGQKTEELFMPQELVDFLKPNHIGHELVLDWSVSSGRAFLQNVTVK